MKRIVFLIIFSSAITYGFDKETSNHRPHKVSQVQKLSGQIKAQEQVIVFLRKQAELQKEQISTLSKKIKNLQQAQNVSQNIIIP